MRVGTLGCVLLMTGLVALGACAGGERTGEAEGGGAAETARTEPTPLPDTTAASLWEHLQEANYRDGWSMWPGKEALYTGREPHGMLLTTYVNAAARRALASGAASMPSGAIIVKENYTADSSLAAITVMYKRAGYDRENSDWFWLKRLADGTVEVSGRGQGCIACHGGQASNDYIFTGSLGRSR